MYWIRNLLPHHFAPSYLTYCSSHSDASVSLPSINVVSELATKLRILNSKHSCSCVWFSFDPFKGSTINSHLFTAFFKWPSFVRSEIWSLEMGYLGYEIIRWLYFPCSWWCCLFLSHFFLASLLKSTRMHCSSSKCFTLSPGLQNISYW